MSAAKVSGKKRTEAEAQQSDKRKRDFQEDDDIFDNELSSEIKGIFSALQQIREKAAKDGQKKKEETISSVTAEIKSMFEELKAKIEKERQTFAKALTKSSKECENALKEETVNFQGVYEKFSKEKATYLQSLKDTISKYEEEKERLFVRYEQQRKKEKSMIQEKEKACADKIAELEESLKKKKQDDKTFSLLRKTLGSFLETGSDDEFPQDE
ncbi:nucleoporin GLE1-like [Chenopodium quinoa]|uniref:DNA ligase 1 n=1 Tax=Chenopodium quinoa TaxID=63459 RepID=A0A803LPY2_CHEQI|nr:nucleoporin GLE1-like [Chenopodium quinoa]